MGRQRALICAIGLVLVGCQEPAQRPMLNRVNGTGIADQYVCAPKSVSGSGVHLFESWLYARYNSRLYEFRLESLNETTPSAKRLDGQLSGSWSGSVSHVVPGPYDSFAVVCEGFDDASAALFQATSATLLDYCLIIIDGEIQFSQNGENWILNTSGTLQVRNASTMISREKVLLPNNYGSYYLIPGASGRLALVVGNSNDTPEVRFWYDPLLDRMYPASTLPIDFDKRSYWVDQGHVLSEFQGKIQDHGIIPGFKPVKASENAVALSPWSVTRSEDKKTLVVRSIYRGGPTWTFKRSQGVWSQNTATYGKHALYDSGEFYDLRTGKLAARVEMDDDQDYVIITNKYITGTTKALAQRDIGIPINSEKVFEVLYDLLDLGDSGEDQQ